MPPEVQATAAWNFPVLRILQWLGSHSEVIPALQQLWGRLQEATTWGERFQLLIELLDLVGSIISDFPDLTTMRGTAEDHAEEQAELMGEFKAKGFNPLLLLSLAKFLYDLWKQFNPKNATAFEPQTNPT